MHEFSIAENLLGLCLKSAEQNSAKKINKVRIKIGRLSGIEAHYLNFAFDVLKEKTIAKNAKLEYFMQDLVVYCDDCDSKNSLNDFNIECPKCNGKNVRVIDGEDLFLIDLELEIRSDSE
jgi:hydrogenase nickel incorporation protein HypA/HybF